MKLASPELILVVTSQFHDAEAAAVNAAATKATGGILPCYALHRNKRGGFTWVSVGSSAVISRSVARDWLRRVGVDLDSVERAASSGTVGRWGGCK